MQIADVEKIKALYHTARYHRLLLLKQCNRSHVHWSKEDWQVYHRDMDIATKNYQFLGKLLLINTSAANHF
jgi:hypothetical protein